MLPDVLDFPVGQFVHDRVPGDAEYVPDWHMPQLDAATAFENVPGAHKVQPGDPADVNLPCVQSMHVEMDAAPSCAECVPATQALLPVAPPGQ